jgi:hypothetical protein
MKTLEQTLEELKQLETIVNSGLDTISEEQLSKIVDQLESAYSIAYGELENVKEEAIKLSTETENENENNDEE